MSYWFCCFFSCILYSNVKNLKCDCGFFFVICLPLSLKVSCNPMKNRDVFCCCHFTCCSLWLVVVIMSQTQTKLYIEKKPMKNDCNRSLSGRITDFNNKKKPQNCVQKIHMETPATQERKKSPNERILFWCYCDCKVHNKNSWYFSKHYYYRHYPRRV